MMKWGTEIGTKLAGALGALADGDVGGAFAALWGDVDWGDLVWKVLKLVITPIAIGDLIFGMMGEGDNSGFNAMGQAIKKWYEEGIASITPQWNEYWTSVKKWFNDGLDGITAQWNTIFYQIIGWFGAGLTTVTSSWNTMFNKVKDWIGDGLGNITNKWSDMFWVVYHWLKDGLAGIGTSFMNIGGLITGAIENAANLDLNGNGTIGMADGGQINEHIIGVGKSGQIYQFGERGSETVTPNSGGGSGGITINIQNMSASQQDLNNLRQTVLDVVQEANSRRGRI